MATTATAASSTAVALSSLGAAVIVALLGAGAAGCDRVLGLGSLDYAGRDGGGLAAHDASVDVTTDVPVDVDVGSADGEAGDSNDIVPDAGADTVTDAGAGAEGGRDATLDSKPEAATGDAMQRDDVGADTSIPCEASDCCPTVQCGSCVDTCGVTAFCNMNACPPGQACNFGTNLCCTPECDAAAYCVPDGCGRRCGGAPIAPTAGCRSDNDCCTSGELSCSNGGCTFSCLPSGRTCADPSVCCFPLSCDAGFCGT